MKICVNFARKKKKSLAGNYLFLAANFAPCLCVIPSSVPPTDGAPGERSASGLLEWESINDAMEALAMMNHYQMQNPSELSIMISYIL